MDCSPLGSSAHGIFQARRLEWVSIPFSRESSRPRGWTCVSCIAGRHLTIWVHQGNPFILGIKVNFYGVLLCSLSSFANQILQNRQNLPSYIFNYYLEKAFQSPKFISSQLKQIFHLSLLFFIALSFQVSSYVFPNKKTTCPSLYHLSGEAWKKAGSNLACLLCLSHPTGWLQQREPQLLSYKHFLMSSWSVKGAHCPGISLVVQRLRLHASNALIGELRSNTPRSMANK